jgi:hypothetical protein
VGTYGEIEQLLLPRDRAEQVAAKPPSP